MKLTIERAALLRSLNHVQSVVERRNTIPILANVLLHAEDGSVKLTATDMDIAIVEAAPADVHAAGETTAPAHTLYEIVRKLPEGAQIELEAGDDKLVLKAGRSKFVLAALMEKNDDLESCHRICQEAGQDDVCGNYWHGIVHRREPDFENARGWFRRTEGLTAYADIYTGVLGFLQNLIFWSGEMREVSGSMDSFRRKWKSSIRLSLLISLASSHKRIQRISCPCHQSSISRRDTMTRR